MLRRTSEAVRNDYSAVAKLAHESGEPIYITENGTEDTVIMDVNTFRRMEQTCRLKLKIEEAENARLNGCPVFTVDEVRERLRRKYDV